MARRMVTPVANFIDNGDGSYDLKNPDDFGYLEKTHFLQASIVNPETGLTEIGVVSRLEISWELRRIPAVHLLDASEVAFIGFEDLNNDDDFEEDDSNEERFEEVEEHQVVDASARFT